MKNSKPISDKGSRSTFIVILALFILIGLVAFRFAPAKQEAKKPADEVPISNEVAPEVPKTAEAAPVETVEEPVETPVTNNLAEGEERFTLTVKPIFGKPPMTNRVARPLQSN